MTAETLPEKIGPYQVVGLLGRGGMGAVYKAYKPPLNKRFVAVKIIKAEFISTPGALERFRREAALAAELKHPNIVTVYDYEEVPGGDSYIVTELIEGGMTLKDQLVQRGSLSLTEAAEDLKQVAAALDYAYESHHIVHRDIKPSNIFIDGKRIALGDFGIAKDISANTQLTSMGEGVGTPDYMSPEQAMGDPLDRRSDIYSLGIMAFEMLIGSVPFKGDTPISVVMGHIQKPVPSIRSLNPNLPPQIENVINKALSKRKEDRYQTASEFAAAFEAAAKGVTAAPTMIGGTAGFASSPEATAISQGLNLVKMLESQGRYQEAFDQLNTLRQQYPNIEQVNAHYQDYVRQGYVPSNARPNPTPAPNLGGNYYQQNSGSTMVTNATPYPITNTTAKKSQLPLFIGGGIATLVVVVIIIVLVSSKPKPTPTPTAIAATVAATTTTSAATNTTTGATTTTATTTGATTKVAANTTAPATANNTTPTVGSVFGATTAAAGGNVYAGPVTQNNYVVSVISVELESKDSLDDAPKTGNLFLALNISIGSKASSGVDANPLYAQLNDSDGNSYDPEPFNSKTPELPAQNDIASGQSVTGWLMFEVPSSAKGLSFVYTPIATDNTEVQVPLGDMSAIVAKLPASSGSSATSGSGNSQADQLDNAGLDLFNKGDYNGAVNDYLQAIKLDPKSAVYHGDLARAYIELGKYDLAQNEAKTAISLDSSKATYHNTLGVALDDAGKYADAEQAYKDAITLSNQDELYYVNLSLNLIDQDKYDEAAQQAQKAISLDAKDAQAYDALGEADQYLGSDHYADAEKAYQKALQLEPANKYYNADYSDLLSDENKGTDAETYARKAIAADANYGVGYNVLGYALEVQKRYKDAAAAYLKATQIEPKNAVYLRNLANTYDEAQDYANAQKAVDAALKLEPDNARGNAIQGDIYYDQQQYNKALTAYQKAAQEAADNAEYQVYVGDTYAALGDNTNAKKYYNQALAIDPNNTDAQNGLSKLGS